ncbi:MAG: CPBP family intramembrane metalloprotease [Clostridia bacterium]|nr:CPBP family intramembrane metalloprotease [Clostridia bacterium]
MKRSKGFLLVPIFLLAVYLLLLLTNLVPEDSVDTTAKLFLSLVVLELIVFALPSFFYTKLRGDALTKLLPLRGFSPHMIPFLLATACLILTFGLCANGIFYFLGIGKEGYTALGSYILSDISSETNPLYAMFAYGAIPAICEEFFFRGIVYHEYKPYSTLTATLFSAFTYAMCYFDLSGFPFYFLSGLLLAYTVRITGSLLAPIAVRFAVSLASVYIMPTLWRLLTQPLGVLFAIFVSVAMCMISLFFFLKATETRYRHMAYDPAYATDTPYPKKEARYHTLKAFTSPLFLTSLAIFLTAAIVFILT